MRIILEVKVLNTSLILSNTTKHSHHSLLVLLLVIGVDENYIEAEGAKYIAVLLQVNNTLEFLDLSMLQY